jgi:hypothetical protein
MKYDPKALCGLCSRELGTERIQYHHLLPKSCGGKDTVPIHQICHRHVHATFTEKELAKGYTTFEALLTHEAVQAFVKWVAKKNPAYYDSSDTAKRKRK